MTTPQPILRVEGIHKTLGDQLVLNDVSLTVNRGEVKILIGPSGSGKSTLLQCLNFLHHPDQGRIWLDGREFKATSRRELCAFRQQVGMIFQDFNLFDHLTALGNVQIALIKVKGMAKAKATHRAKEELARVGLADKMDLYPAQLSGGQKQRVSMARALAMDPKVLLLDEPTSALDPELIGEVLAVIRFLASAGMTMIMATHQIAFSATMAHEFLFMEKGRIVERGSPVHLLAPGATSRTMAFCAKINELSGDLGMAERRCASSSSALADKPQGGHGTT
ncbi:MAG: amino acid ABC transporter ATP-binding protein [Desulfovibrionales bacterium]|nr:MAG: amino acid ABC transporter ATP-binding protein [Desulfovibrionales bacterium]